MANYQDFMQRADETALSLTWTSQNWAAFLTTAALLTIKDGNFTILSDGAFLNDNNPIDPVIMGGTFNTDVSAYVSEGYTAVRQESSNTWVVLALLTAF